MVSKNNIIAVVASCLLFSGFFGCGGKTDISLIAGSGSGSAELSWDVPTQNIDGSPASIAGYKVYFGPISRLYTQYYDVGNVTSISVTGIPSGTYCVAVTAYDGNGSESDFSNELVHVIN